MSYESQINIESAFHDWCVEIGNLCIAMHIEELSNDDNESMAKAFMDGVTAEEHIKEGIK